MKSLLKRLLVEVAKPTLKKVHKYKGLHVGEDCYVIGGGISLKWFDLEIFSDKISIPLAFLPFHRDFSKLDARYLMLPEPWFFYPYIKTTVGSKKYIKNYLEVAYRNVIARNPDKEFFVNLSNYPMLKNENITYLFNDLCDDKLPRDFISYRLNSFHGSLRTAILMAIYMGFDHIYLVGCDYTHMPARSLHWFEKGQGNIIQIENYQKDFFQIANEFIDITTITLDGKSELIDSITYKQHTGRDPMFRENIELIDGRYLEALSTWPDYYI